MQHLYRNNDHEVVAADTEEQANHFYWFECCGDDRKEEWYQIPDDEILTLVETDEPGQPRETKTAGVWASEFAKPCQFSTTYT